jgi:hypothetical protein
LKFIVYIFSDFFVYFFGVEPKYRHINQFSKK